MRFPDRFFIYLRKKIARRGRTADVQRIGRERFFAESEVAIPTHIVEHKSQTLALARPEARQGDIKDLTCAMCIKVGWAFTCASPQTAAVVGRVNKVCYFQRHEMLIFRLCEIEEPARLIGNVKQRSNSRWRRLPEILLVSSILRSDVPVDIEPIIR